MTAISVKMRREQLQRIERDRKKKEKNISLPEDSKYRNSLQSHSHNLSKKTKRRKTSFRVGDKRKKSVRETENGKILSPKTSPKSREEQENFEVRAGSRVAINKRGRVRVIKRKQIGGDDLMKRSTLFPRGFGVRIEIQRKWYRFEASRMKNF